MRLNEKPEFCYIAPIEYLSCVTVSDSHLVLAHLVDASERYADFYKTLSDCGDQYIMLDNSAYELKEPYNPHKLTRLAEKCGAHAIVLPDYPFQPVSKTIDASKAYLPVVKSAGYDAFFVPQSKRGDLEGWISGYQWASENGDIDIIGMSILGIPNALPKIAPSYARVVMSSILLDRGIFNFNKKHHFLGLNSGVALEIPSLLRMGVLDTVDSSGPIHAALNMHKYTTDADSYQTVSKIKTPVDFFVDRTTDVNTLQRIEHNIQMTQELFTGGDDSSVWYAES